MQKDPCQPCSEMILARFDSIDETMKKLETSILGNGHPGLMTRVALLEDNNKRISRLTGALITSGAACIVSGAGAAVIWLIKHV